MPAPVIVGGPPAGLPFQSRRVVTPRGGGTASSSRLPTDESGRVSVRTLVEAQRWADTMFGSNGTINDYRVGLGVTSARLFVYAPGGCALVTFLFGVAGPATNYVTACEPVLDFQSVSARFIDETHGFAAP